MKNKKVCAICRKNLSEAASEYGAVFPIDPKGAKDRRWVCSIHLKRSDIPPDTLSITNNLCGSLNGTTIAFYEVAEKVT